MSNVNIDFLQGAGFRQLLNSDEVKDMVEGHVNAIKARADAGLNGAESQGFNGRGEQGNYAGGRWIGIVGTSDLATMIAESEDKVLTKAVHG